MLRLNINIIGRTNSKTNINIQIPNTYSLCALCRQAATEPLANDLRLLALFITNDFRKAYQPRKAHKEYYVSIISLCSTNFSLHTSEWTSPMHSTLQIAQPFIINKNILVHVFWPHKKEIVTCRPEGRKLNDEHTTLLPENCLELLRMPS